MFPGLGLMGFIAAMASQIGDFDMLIPTLIPQVDRFADTLPAEPVDSVALFGAKPCGIA
jgi:hypothetical protein